QAGDVLYISVHDSQLPTAEIISYTVVGGNTTTSIASSFASAINGNTTLSTLGVTATSAGPVVTISSSSTTQTSYTQTTSTNATETITLSTSAGTTASINPSTSLSGSPTLAAGLNTVSVTAVSGGGTPTTNTYPITIASAPTKSFSFDANGNMTNTDTGTYPQYSYDAENRLIQIAYDGTNSTNMLYDAAGHRSQITETYNGVVLSTNNFVWCGDKLGEARLADSSLWRQYFRLGQISFTAGVGTNYFYNLDHLGSVREMTDASGAIVSQTTYDPYGIPTKLQGSISADFGYAGMYQHQRSGLNLTMYRAYSPTLGRWQGRDPLGEAAGTNLYRYSLNSPIVYKDPLGLDIVILYDPTALHGLGHAAALVGNESDGWIYYSNELNFPGIPPRFRGLDDFFEKYDRYRPENSALFDTTDEQDAAAHAAGQNSVDYYKFPSHTCANTTRDIANAAGLKLGKGGFLGTGFGATPRGVFRGAIRAHGIRLGL
ncbi:MAG: hypothetical protein K5Q00_07310, partial [Gammaproteobacteria bacterium]|nr:hypothetical protein [Gammaproteobacteria bacterium]